MQLTITTDYAIRCVLYLASHQGICSSGEIASATGISQQYITRIMGKLKRRKLVQGHTGKFGGYSLSRSADKISLLDVISIMEKTSLINYCTAKRGGCTKKEQISCQVRKILLEAQETFERQLNAVTIAQLMENGGLSEDGLVIS